MPPDSLHLVIVSCLTRFAGVVGVSKEASSNVRGGRSYVQVIRWRALDAAVDRG